MLQYQYLDNVLQIIILKCHVYQYHRVLHSADDNIHTLGTESPKNLAIA